MNLESLPQPCPGASPYRFRSRLVPHNEAARELERLIDGIAKGILMEEITGPPT
jgi:hypothetical protein